MKFSLDEKNKIPNAPYSTSDRIKVKNVKGLVQHFEKHLNLLFN